MNPDVITTENLAELINDSQKDILTANVSFREDLKNTNALNEATLHIKKIVESSCPADSFHESWRKYKEVNHIE